VSLLEPDEDCRIVCDRDRLVRSLRHLLDNAIVHGGEGIVEFRATPERDGQIVFSIADGGPGIPDERLAASLQPLSPPDGILTRSHEGLGLGLPIARRVASLHGGGLEIETGSGEGTTVRLTIPRSRVVARPSACIAKPERESVPEGCR